VTEGRAADFVAAQHDGYAYADLEGQISIDHPLNPGD
jgi:hypothetical protein